MIIWTLLKWKPYMRNMFNRIALKYFRNSCAFLCRGSRRLNALLRCWYRRRKQIFINDQPTARHWYHEKECRKYSPKPMVERFHNPKHHANSLLWKSSTEYFFWLVIFIYPLNKTLAPYSKPLYENNIKGWKGKINANPTIKRFHSLEEACNWRIKTWRTYRIRHWP